MNAELPAVMKRAAFAQHIGVRRGYVTQLAKEGRLVCDAQGRVLVPESLERIEATKSPDKAHVADRWEEHRSGQGAEAQESVAAADSKAPDQPDAAPAAGPLGRITYTDARSLREQYQVLTAKADYEARMCQLCAVDDVQRAGADVGATIRTQHESLADRLAPELASADTPERCYAILADAFEESLRDISGMLQRLGGDGSQKEGGDAG